MLRNKMNSAAERAITAARNYYDEHPRRLALTQRLFTDLRNKHLQNLMQRAAALNPLDLVLASRNHLPPPAAAWRKRETEKLLAALKQARTVIADFLTAYRPQGNPGNHGPLLRVFVEQVFDLWQEFLWTEGSPDEDRRFISFVAAAWRDFGFPMQNEKGQLLEEKGQLLEDWIKSRVLNHFPDGVCDARLSWQNEALYAAALTNSCD